MKFCKPKCLYRQITDPNFDPKEFQRIKEKWTKLLEQQGALRFMVLIFYSFNI